MKSHTLPVATMPKTETHTSNNWTEPVNPPPPPQSSPHPIPPPPPPPSPLINLQPNQRTKNLHHYYIPIFFPEKKNHRRKRSVSICQVFVRESERYYVSTARKRKERICGFPIPTGVFLIYAPEFVFFYSYLGLGGGHRTVSFSALRYILFSFLRRSGLNNIWQSEVRGVHSRVAKTPEHQKQSNKSRTVRQRTPFSSFCSCWQNAKKNLSLSLFSCLSICATARLVYPSFFRSDPLSEKEKKRVSHLWGFGSGVACLVARFYLS